jgi:transcriptional regulator with XRE-family HTH domain
MTQLRTDPSRPSPVGALLQHWRQVRHMSQLALATEAEVSPRHVCFIETGRAQPSREMVLLLASALDVPLRERNSLLLAAGYAPMYRESNLDAPELAAARAALDAILRQQEPFPAVVMNRRWDLLSSNDAASRFFGFLLDPAPAPESPNVLRMMFDPRGLRPYVVNWEAAAEALVRRVHREAVGGAPDGPTLELLDEVLAFPGVPRSWRKPNLETPLVPVIPVIFRKGSRTFSFFSAVTTLGTAQDITLQEIRIECFFPLDAETERQAAELRRATLHHES